ncbi:hypothetical protein [Frigoribacterium endophyticum]|uniref:hypothetical protein n=1 Tax=Frigoribacterium endophyticum TaxID=1522176 RepID=UPI001FBA9D8B|nr:hypothetical protein [Frigoribacterium endophyticum]NII52159.1 hypothetical protein [Frigoribacterium endophyticum]
MIPAGLRTGAEFPSERAVPVMQIDKKLILQHLDGLGKHDEAARAHDELPDTVDTDTHADLLAQFGIDPGDMRGSLGALFGK